MQGICFLLTMRQNYRVLTLFNFDPLDNEACGLILLLQCLSICPGHVLGQGGWRLSSALCAQILNRL